MIKRLALLAFQFLLAGFLLFLCVFIYVTTAPLFQRNVISMVSGPFLDEMQLLGPDAHLDKIFEWKYKAPLTIAIPRRVENCASSKFLQSAAALELLAVDSLCNISSHTTAKNFLVRCMPPVSDDSHVCFASAQIGGLHFGWKRLSFDEGVAKLNSHTYLRTVTPLLALDERVSSLSNSDAYGRAFNGSFSRSPIELAEYVKSVNSKLESGNYAQVQHYELSLPFKWNFRRESWEIQNVPRIPGGHPYVSDFQTKFQYVVAPQ